VRTLDLGSGVKFEVVWVPAGKFRMGSPTNELLESEDRHLRTEFLLVAHKVSRTGFETPTHTVRMTEGFWMGKYEVTQQQYELLIGVNPSFSANAGPEAPVEHVSWNDAQAFCRKVMERLTGTWTNWTARLPTEAEWEYACRNGTSGAFNSDDACTVPEGRDPAMERLGWFRENSSNMVHSVGQKTPNRLGLHDMHGNVWEWCGDWFGVYSAEPAVDPTGPETGFYRVVRGGCFQEVAANCRSACRAVTGAATCAQDVGFRVVLTRLHLQPTVLIAKESPVENDRRRTFTSSADASRPKGQGVQR
jgi:formylglycine-generating enzyme required for sulfatase activity